MASTSGEFISFSGSVVQGRGEARKLVGEHRNEILALTGVDCIPGSLNIVFSKPVALRTSTATVFGHDRRLWIGSLNGQQVLVARWKRARQHICEVYADRHLRAAFNLEDGDKVTLTMRTTDVAETPRRVRFLSRLLWGGVRGRWFYTSDVYRLVTSPVEILCRTLQN